VNNKGVLDIGAIIQDKVKLLNYIWVIFITKYKLKRNLEINNLRYRCADCDLLVSMCSFFITIYTCEKKMFKTI